MMNGEGKHGTEGSAPPTPEPTNFSPRILVVDDESYIRDLIIKMLAHFGFHKIGTARDGAEAWQALHEASYGLVITDHKMPKVTGLELIQKMRSENMWQPVILISGMMPVDDLGRNPDLRVDAVLPKPFTTAELLAAMEKILPTTNRSTTMKNSPAQSPETQAIMPPHGRTKNPAFRILVVDDDRECRKFNVNMLISAGYEAEGVDDGASGWEALQTHDYDLVITDNHMPRMTGVEMIEKLNSARMTIPIIMATGNMPLAEFTRRPWLKPDAMLQKPFADGELLVMVRNVLGPDDGRQGSMQTRLPNHL